ncbi:MAG: hypothetical protein L3K03_07740 [Thermoplasmata archaeon]|nr:hypothetical protein [Thermoplasmata archaeon]
MESYFSPGITSRRRTPVACPECNRSMEVTGLRTHLRESHACDTTKLEQLLTQARRLGARRAPLR